ncbi:MAG: hypothetical protein GXO55_07755 [Chloroflexi bacterium]|nr:hypothetical protein [Chloroflexota bacterium]
MDHGSWPKEEGQSLTELALILPVMLLLLAIALDAGRAMMTHMEVVHAAREGAWVAARPVTSEVMARRATLDALREAGLDPARASVSVVIRSPGQPVEVRVSYTYRPLMSFLPLRSITLRARQTAVRW